MIRKIFSVFTAALLSALTIQAEDITSAFSNADFSLDTQTYYANGFDYAAVYNVVGWHDLYTDGDGAYDAGIQSTDAWWGNYNGYSAFMSANDGAYLQSSYIIQAADIYYFSIVAKTWSGGSTTARITLFYGDDPTANALGTFDITTSGIYTSFTDTNGISATAAAAGQTLGFAIDNTGANFLCWDDCSIDKQVPTGPVTITAQPEDLSVEEALPAIFQIDHYGTLPVEVMWFRDEELIPDATNKIYRMDAVSLDDDGAVFHAEVMNEYEGAFYNEVSSNAVLSVIADTIAPMPERATSLFPSAVQVRFSEKVDEASAEALKNYSITYAGGTLALSTAMLLEDGKTVELSTGTQTLNESYTLHVSNVQDLANTPNTIAADSTISFFASDYYSENIGGSSVEGSSDWMDGGADITAAGSGVGGSSDAFSFSHKSYSGDFDVQVRIDSMEFLNQWAQAGLMARGGTDSDALFAAVFATPGPAGCYAMARTTVGGSAVSDGSFPTAFPSMWLRLRRTGDLFEGFAGIDGETWEPLASLTIAMSTDIEVGLVVSSAESDTAITVAFREVSDGSGSIVSSIALPFEPLGPSSRRGAMVISEMMIAPPAEWGGTNSMEFVEIYNSGLITEDLTGHRFSGEIDYTFPDGTMLAPGEFLVIARDPAAASEYYGVTCLGPYDGKLSNSGGLLRLRNELDGILLEVEYNDQVPWPVAAFGTGHSLVLSHPSYGENDARAWSISDQVGGSPGTFEGYSADPARSVVINEYLAHTDLPQVDYVELFNTGSVAVDLSGAWLSDELGTNKFRIPDGTSIPARGFLSFDQTQLGFALSADGEELVLMNAEQSRVLDALSFRGQENGVSEGRYPDGAPGFQELASVTKGGANTAPTVRDVVINEIMYHPISDLDDDEYIELYNRSGSAIDLTSWKLQGGVSYTFPEGAEIPAYGYIVVAENATNLIANYSQLSSENTFGNYDGTLGNNGDTFRLSMPEDLISTNSLGGLETNIFYIAIDEVSYLDGGRWGAWSDGGGSSLELMDPDADNRQPSSWADSDESEKAAWTTIDVTAVLENGQAWVDEGSAYGTAANCNRLELFMQGEGEVLIDDVEFLNNGGSSLVQNGNFSSAESYWAFGGVVRNSYAENGVLHLVSVARGDTGCNKAYNELSAVPSITGSDTGTIRAKVRWLKGATQILFRLRGNWMEAHVELKVPTNCGTPGAVNSQRISNAGPSIYDVTHFPILPKANEEVVVTARATDPDGVSAMTLCYRVDPSSTYSYTAMNDIGIGVDAVAGDGLYSAAIPEQAADTLVAFYVYAYDGAVTSTFPANVPERECLVNWGEPEFSGSLGTYHLWVTDANLDFWASREKNANDTMDATFVYGNSRVIYNVDTMYSASPFHTPAYNGPLGAMACDYEINFQKDERFLGAEPFVLNAEDDNASYRFWFDLTSQVDLTGTWIARKLGQQYNYRRHVHMMLNGQERGMIYLDTQQPNSDMLDEYFPEDSQEELRKIESWFEFADDFSSQGSVYARLDPVVNSAGELDPKWYRWQWRPRATSDHNNWFNFTNLVMAVNDSSSANWESRVRTWMDVENFLRPIVAHHVCGSWDSYAYDRGKNMYAFKPNDKGWRLLMWDIELALGNGSDGTTDSIYWSKDSALLNVITSIPSIEREYLRAFQEAVDGPMASGVAAAILNERYTNLLANGVSVSDPSTIISFIDARRSYIEGVLPTASFSASAASSVDENSVTLTGTAPLQVAEIEVNGIDYPVTWTSTTAWSITVPLSTGENVLSVVGLNGDDVAIEGAFAALSVIYSGTDPDPAGVVVFNEIYPSPEKPDLQFIELYNTSSSDTFYLDDWRINGLGYTFDRGDMIGPGEYILLVNDTFEFANRYPDAPIFDDYAGSLDPEAETLTLFRPIGTNGVEEVVDRVRYESSAPWASSASGNSLQLIDAMQDNARVANWGNSATFIQGGVLGTNTLIDVDHVWNYYADGDPGPGNGWETVSYDDSAWNSGASLLYNKNVNYPWATGDTLPYVRGQMAYYLRTTFDYTNSVDGAELRFFAVIDDGAIIYLNGTEVYRLRMADGEVDYTTSASSTIVTATEEGPFTISADALVEGENVLAVEVHQRGSSSSDVVMGIKLEAIAESGDTTIFAPLTSPGWINSSTNTLAAVPSIWLNELQADNTSGEQDNADDFDPWVELYNAGDSAFSLDGYYLTDDYSNPTNWAFPTGTTVPANGCLLVWCDGETDESEAGIPHTDFVLPSSAGQVGLVRLVDDEPQVLDYLNYTNLPANYSYGDVPDGQPFYRYEMFYATPGITNTGASAPLTVSINEWVADNEGSLRDPADNDDEDWFELYNPGTNAVDLGGYFLTDDLTDPFKFEVPDNGQYTIEPHGFLLVWADGEDAQNTADQEDLHADFKLGKSGESIGVFAADGTCIDSVTFGEQTTDLSEGRFPDGAATLLPLAWNTPREANVAANTAPTLEAIADAVLTLGKTLEFTATATDSDSPAQTLLFCLTNAPPGATIGATSGSFSWTPEAAASSQQVGVVVTDDGTPVMSAVEWFAITVLSPPTVDEVSISGTDISVSWESEVGQSYRVYFKTSLDELYWEALTDPISGDGEILFYNDSTTNLPHCFFTIGVE